MKPWLEDWIDRLPDPIRDWVYDRLEPAPARTDATPDRAAFAARDWVATNPRATAGLILVAAGVAIAAWAIVRKPTIDTLAGRTLLSLPPSFAKLTPDNPFEDHARLQEEKLRQKEKQLQELSGRLEHLATELDSVRRTADEAKADAKEAATSRPAITPSASATGSAEPVAKRTDLKALAEQVASLSSDRARAATRGAAERVGTGIRPLSPGAGPSDVATSRSGDPSVRLPPGGDAVEGGLGVDRFAGGIRFASADRVRLPTPPVAAKAPFVLQAGSFARGRVLFGLDAPTDASHDQAPAIAIEAIDTFKGPNSGSTPLTGCMFLGSARGDFSSARVVVKITTISCTFGDVPLEKEITGLVIGPDDKSGVPGELVDHLLEKASWATVAGVGEGTAEAFKQGATTQVVSGVTGSVTSVVDPEKVGTYAVASGAAGAARQLGTVAFDRIEKLAPYVSIAGGETVWIYVLKGTSLEGLDQWITTAGAEPASNG